MHRPLTIRHAMQGFTLIELLMVVAIIGILGAIAMPSYFQYIARGHRSDAKVALMNDAQFMERVFTECNTYANMDDNDADFNCDDALALPVTRAPQEGTAVYNVALSGAATATTFTIAATPIVGGAMDGDACGTLTINEAGVKAVTGGATLTAAECWNR